MRAARERERRKFLRLYCPEYSKNALVIERREKSAYGKYTRARARVFARLRWKRIEVNLGDNYTFMNAYGFCMYVNVRECSYRITYCTSLALNENCMRPVRSNFIPRRASGRGSAFAFPIFPRQHLRVITADGGL